jgi:seryl-tRNA synthetase
MTDLNTVHKAFLLELVEARLLVETGVRGIYGRSGAFERVIDGIEHVVGVASKPDKPEELRFPPVVTRKNFEKSGYMKSFPQLAGSIHVFKGNDKAHQELLATIDSGDDWAKALVPADVVLKPAACYPVYPIASGTVPEGGRLFDVMSYCFRHEPSDDPARMQLFRMHELIRMGTPDDVRAFREVWFERGQKVLKDLDLDAKPVVANDPFFGRGGKVLAISQRELELKFELVVPICSEAEPTAVVSLNYHQDHFAHIFDIKTSSGEYAHTSCIGFGLERIALAMLKKHGLDSSRWNPALRARLGFAPVEAS